MLAKAQAPRSLWDISFSSCDVWATDTSSDGRPGRCLDSEKLYPCNICNYQTSWKYAISQHMKVHQPKENIVCTGCNRTIRKSYLTKHKKLNHSEEQPQYNCNICPYQTSYKHNLRRHEINIHNIQEWKSETMIYRPSVCKL